MYQQNQDSKAKMIHFSKTFANVLQNFLSLLHDCCGTFANCFDTERNPSRNPSLRRLSTGRLEAVFPQPIGDQWINATDWSYTERSPEVAG